MTYASKLLKTMELRDFPGYKGLDLDIIDKIIEKREIAQNRRRYVCKVCNIMTSTSKSCYCD
jgi:hypothetical protein